MIAEVITMDEPRDVVTKFGKKMRVANAMIKDDTGKMTLTLWNEDIDTIRQGDTIKITNGWCSEFRDIITISAGKFGKITKSSQTGLEGV